MKKNLSLKSLPTIAATNAGVRSSSPTACFHPHGSRANILQQLATHVSLVHQGVTVKSTKAGIEKNMDEIRESTRPSAVVRICGLSTLGKK